MTDAAEQFDERGNSTAPWWCFGRNLLVAANVLRQRVLSHDQFRIAEPHQRGTSIAVFGPMMLLRASALECLLKAMYLDRGHRLAKAGRYTKPPAKDHDLVALARLVGVGGSTDVEALLAKLERYITAGRYPIETTAERMYCDDASGYAWSESDEARFVALVEKLFQENGRLGEE